LKYILLLAVASDSVRLFKSLNFYNGQERKDYL